MSQASLDAATARALGEVLARAIGLAWTRASTVLKRLRTLLVPPRGLELVAPEGALYSGLLLVESGKVVAGMVVLAGHQSRQVAEPVEEPRESERWSDAQDEDDRVSWRMR